MFRAAVVVDVGAGHTLSVRSNPCCRGACKHSAAEPQDFLVHASRDAAESETRVIEVLRIGQLGFLSFNLGLLLFSCCGV